MLSTQVEEELSKDAAQRLRVWAVKKGYQNQLYAGNFSPSIDQMVEYLEQFYPINMDHYVYEGKNYWIVNLWDKNRQSLIFSKEKFTNLVDALWSVVKQFLEVPGA